jgi:hypothetical protein
MTEAVMTAPERVSSLDTQSDSYRAINPKKLAKQQQEILDVVASGCHPMVGDMSLVEIQRAYEATYNTRIDVARVSARVSNLIAGGQLHRKVDPRPCTITRRMVHPVFPAQKQTSFV